MSSCQPGMAFALLQAEGPDASARLEGHIITRVIIRLVVGAVLGTVMGAIFGLVLYLIFGWLLAGVTTFLGLNILQTPPGLYIGAIVGSLFGAIAALIFVGAVNIAEASVLFIFWGRFRWLTYERFGSFTGATEAVISGVSIGVLVGAIASFVAGAISEGGIERAFA
jgi:hypothetical protein